MSEHRDEKWLDEQLQRAVGGSTPMFDAQAWKRKYAREFQTLLGGSSQPSQSGLGHIMRLVLRGSIGKLAIAAVVLITACLLLPGRHGAAPVQPVPNLQSTTRPSPAQMVSMISLSAAFRSGGMEGLDKQCDRALETLGPRPTIVYVQEFFRDLNSKG